MHLKKLNKKKAKTFVRKLLTFVFEVLHQLLVVIRQFFGSDNIDLIKDYNDRFVNEQRFNIGKQLDLFFDAVATLLGEIHKIKHSSSQMGKSSDGLKQKK